MKLAIVQRDGVVCQGTPQRRGSRSDKLVAIPGSIAALALLSQAGWRVVLVNREARFTHNVERIHALHEQLRRRVEEAGGEIEAYCSIGGRESMAKLLAKVVQRYRTDFNGVPVFGDNHHILRGAVRLGARPILVRTGQGARVLGDDLGDLEGVTIYGDLAGAVDAWLIEHPGAASLG